MILGGCSTPLVLPDADSSAAEGLLGEGRDSDVVLEVDARAGLELAEEKRELSPEEVPLLRCEPGAGCFLDHCDDNNQCQSGWCVLHLGNGVCSQTCQEECPAGWGCKQVAGTDPDLVYVCVSHYAHLCRPCSTNGDCTSTGGAEDACVDYGTAGSFCGGSCGDGAPGGSGQVCPWGFSCKEVTTVEGSTLQQCVNDTGECPCTASSVSLGLTTPCAVENEFGSCEGKRTCTADGLTECDAPVAAGELCNDEDDDCDGEVDEPHLVDGNYVNLCDDGNDCTEDKCAGGEGCLNEVLETGSCDDDNPCTVADHCDQGVCLGDPVECDDDNPCTDNVCTETGGCEYPPNSGPCDDTNPCTLADQCVDGDCLGTEVPCDCLVDEDCGELEDGNLCNGTLVCLTSQLPYHCSVDEATLIVCPEPEGVDAFCLQPHCEPSTGACSLVPHHGGFLCDNGNLCTVGDKCTEGVCLGGEEVNCNDGNGCTDDSCAPDSGCGHTPNALACNDGDVCTTQDTCSEGVCEGGPPLDCSDGDLCNGVESCDPQWGCLDGEPLDCNDGDPCTQDICSPESGCLPDQPVVCDDQNLCTADSCDPANGQCLFISVCDCDLCSLCICDGETGQVECLSKCDDSNQCTLDTCQPDTGECLYDLVDCTDDSVCTDHVCDPLKGCVTTLNQAPCDDGNICTLADHCQTGECVSSQSLVCDDQNTCTWDSCDPEIGCLFISHDGQCDDDDACTSGDMCVGGWCVA